MGAAVHPIERAMALQRLVASATDLMAAAGQPASGGSLGGLGAVRLASGDLPPVCMEPYCGGFHWDSCGNLSSGDSTSSWANGAPATDGSRPMMRLDFPNAQFFPALNPPAASYVKLLPANADHYDWWKNPHAVKVVIKRRSERRFLAQVLNMFMHVAHSAILGGRRVARGLELLSVKPKGGKLRVKPWLGGMEQLLHGRLPMELTFGGHIAGEPHLPNDTPVVERAPLTAPVLPVKRLDIVLRPAETATARGGVVPPLAAPTDFLQLQGRAALRRPLCVPLLRDFLFAT
mmetsp:Transcript_79130/g.218957  ORF Transcript_79130/g.218957 Transcript_79130/m.218957 type:complete len:290 (-) Transcript_79130:115-984(-)